MKHNWTGLLVEPMPCELQYKHRKAYTSPTCLAIQPRPHYVDFNHEATIIDPELGLRSMPGIVSTEAKNTMKMQCIPLYSMLVALNNPTVNWFILDVEGAELAVLKTLPWDKVDIEVISVETDLAGMVMDGTRQDIIDYMKSVGYTHKKHTNSWSTFAEEEVPKDDMFIRNDVIREIELKAKLDL